ncbi:hypothetical protein F7R91_14520 [Streptomyces luteolifulvus]|uniref:Uncharacterized protein n=1 Tax=Streptomyces luteolifulvus TaxID=2615112 RepID=A0A6H9UZX0_9ACTN|nr:hypothetical protein [Streptomyces luteolifulvus]KAB1146791.1 hypothetical protein F7R91_14520 [Streptomyces luteolifulvus]
MNSQTLPPPQGPEYTPCGCGHIEPEHELNAGECRSCDCSAYRPAVSSCVPAATPDDAPVDPSLRDRIAEALRPGSRDRSGCYPEGLMRDVDAVLAVLPAATSQAAILNAATPDDEPQFGVPGCTCRPFTRQETPPRYLDQPGDTVDMITDCPHHARAGSVDPASLRDRIAAVLREHGMVHLGDQVPADEYDCCADAVLAVLPATDRAAALLDDDEGDELVCVDLCGSCDACGMEPFGTPAEGWREAARFLRRTARASGDRQGALHGARMIEAELRRMADETPQPAPAASGPDLARLLATHTDSLAATIEGFTGIAAGSLQPGLKRTLDFLKLYKEQLLTGHWTPEMRRLLDQLAAGAQQQTDTETPEVMLARPAAWASKRQDATVDPARCPRCKGDNQEAFALCATCDQPAPVQPAADDTGDRIVGHRSRLGMFLYCTRHTDELGASGIPITSDDLPDGGLCAKCGTDLLIPQEPRP